MTRVMTPDVRTWNLTETAFSQERLHHTETIFTIGNGYLGTRGAFAEGYPGEIASTLVHGIYNHFSGDLVPDLANFPAWYALAITVNGASFRLDQGRVLGFRHQLNMRHGLLTREVLWQAPDQTVIRLGFERWASLERQHVLAQRMSVLALSPVDELAISAVLDYDRATNTVITTEGMYDAHHWVDVGTGTPDAHHAWWRAATNQSGYRAAMAQHLALAGTTADLESHTAGHSAGSRVVTPLDQGQTLTLTRFVTVATSRDADDPLALARAQLDDAVRAGYEALLAEHKAAWDATWDDMDIVIDGDEYAQHAIRFATYHLVIPAPRHDERVSIGAKTLSGPGYRGHVFWDTELFMLPTFAITQPAIARNLLMYRYHNLPGARRKAREAGYEGALYAWESTDTGDETTPRWTLPDADGNRIRIWTGDHEQHISSDIAYAIWLYWRWTGDDDFLRDYGAEMILDTAVFWGSRAEWNANEGQYELSLQIGPDEFHENVNNSVYTNRLVMWHLNHARETLDWLRAHAPDKAAALVEQLDLTDERLAHWRDVAGKMVIPRYEPLDVYEQFDGFFEMETIDVPAYEPRVINMDVIIGHERTQRTQVLKQADVVMLIALLGDALGSPEELRRNWDVYLPRTAHDSSLSPAIHARVAARLGMVEEAYQFWLKSAGLDLDNNKGNVRDGIHAAASGALWQAIVFGFAGLSVDGDTWRLDPKLPPWWRSVTFTFYHHGQRHRVQVP